MAADAAVFASIFKPEWTEFCAPAYCDAKESAFSKDSTYWYKRRLQFNREMATCATFQGDDQDACYAELRAAEGRKNEVWAVRQEEKYRTSEFNREYNMEKMKYDRIERMIERLKRY